MLKFQRQRVKRYRSIRTSVDFVRIYGSTRLHLLFEQPECDHAWNLMQRQEGTNVNEANAFRWRMRARSAVCTADTCDFNPLTSAIHKNGDNFPNKERDNEKNTNLISLLISRKKKKRRSKIHDTELYLNYRFRKKRGEMYLYIFSFLLLIIKTRLLKTLFHELKK